jgi:hypothetical protein
MTLVAAGFPGSVNDIQWSQYADLLGHDGTDGMSVSVATGDRTVQIAAGISNVCGILAVNDGPITVGPLPANAGSQTRIDRIILRANWSNKTLTATFRQGTPSANPVPPTLTKNRGSLYEVRLAQVIVAPGTGNLSSGDLIAERVPPVAGFYNAASFRSFPDPENGSLVWYQAANSLRVPIDGEYVEIASARADMRPSFAASTTDITFNNTTPSPTAGTPTAPRVGVSFVAPPSGTVKVTVSARLAATVNGTQAICGWQARAGGTIGSGGIELDTNADRSVTVGEVVTTGNPSRVSASHVHLLGSLTPGSTYNIQTMHYVAGGSGQALYRAILVEPV